MELFDISIAARSAQSPERRPVASDLRAERGCVVVQKIAKPAKNVPMTDLGKPNTPAPTVLRGFVAFCTRLWGFCKGLLHDFRYRARLPNARRVLDALRAWNQLRVTRARFAALSKPAPPGDPADLLQRHLAFERMFNSDRPLVAGNRATLLLNGPATYQAMLAAIATARDHVHLETYIFDGDEIGMRFADALIERQRAGVQVALIFDSVGSMATARSFFERMSGTGIAVLEFNPLNPLSGHRRSWTFNHRDHRKLLIVDGELAFIGGVNISKTYSSVPSGRRRQHDAEGAGSNDGWRDTHLRIEGPVVAEFQKLFLATWARQEAAPLPDRNHFPPLSAKGDEIIGAVGSSAEAHDSPIYLALLSAIYRAQQQIHLTIAYFAPDRHLSKALVRAAQRGVDVKLVLPARSDFWAIFHLGRSYYAALLRGGVKIYEREGSVMHAKTMCIDGVWSTLGSSNMDLRSFLHNDEINAVILGRAFAAQMQATFADDLNESSPISHERWQRRSWKLRLKERVARAFAYWL